MDLILNPERGEERAAEMQKSKDEFKTKFKGMDVQKAFKNMFELLWYSKLPCFDIINVTSSANNQRGMLKTCSWKGEKISCSKLFKLVQTDHGMCCAFNMPSADEVLVKSKMTETVKELSIRDSEKRYCSFNEKSYFFDS